MNIDQYRQAVADDMPEKTLQERVRQIAELYGWLYYHTHDSRRSNPGWPDVVLVHPRTGKFLVRELKRMKGRTSQKQRAWLEALERAGIDVGIWRPIDLLTGEIERTLRTLTVPR